MRLNGAALDAAAFEELLDELLTAEHPDERTYDKANGLYKGKYMEGCDYHWTAFKQEAIQAKYLRALRRMQLLSRRLGDAALAADCLRRILSIMPDSEADGRELIRLHLEAGNRSEALRVYRQLEQVVRDQLGVELEDETLKLHKLMGWSG